MQTIGYKLTAIYVNTSIMEQPQIQYEFINYQTGNVIGYLTLPADMDKDQQIAELKKKQSELAIANKIYLELVQWHKKV